MPHPKMLPLTLVALLLFCSHSFGQQTSSVNPHIAVLNLEERGISEDEAATLTDRLRGHLVNTRAFVVLDRNNMETTMRELGLQQSGCTTTQCAVRIGKILNMQKMVTGSIGKVGKTYTIDISVIDVESSRIERSFNRDYRGEIDGLLEALQSMAQEMANAVAGQTKSPANAAKQAYKLTIGSYPKGAEVIINGQAIGQTPLSRQIKAGSSLNIRLKYRGYKDWDKSLTMARDEDLNVEMIRRPKSSSRAWLWVAGGVGAAAIGATAFILTSPDNGGDNKAESLPPLQWPPAEK
jgi:TolB-like protein